MAVIFMSHRRAAKSYPSRASVCAAGETDSDLLIRPEVVIFPYYMVHMLTLNS